MRKYLFFRFVIYTLALYLCVELAGSGLQYIWNLAEYLGYASGNTSSGAMIRFFRNMGSSLVSLLLPSFDFSSILRYILALGITAAAAFFFSHGPAKDYGRLCDMAERIGQGASHKQPAVKSGWKELESRLGQLGRMLASNTHVAREVESKRAAAREDAMVYLAAAKGQLETIAESGLLKPGGAETGIVQQALRNLESAGEALERARGEE